MRRPRVSPIIRRRKAVSGPAIGEITREPRRAGQPRGRGSAGSRYSPRRAREPSCPGGEVDASLNAAWCGPFSTPPFSLNLCSPTRATRQRRRTRAIYSALCARTMMRRPRVSPVIRRKEGCFSPLSGQGQCALGGWNNPRSWFRQGNCPLAGGPVSLPCPRFRSRTPSLPTSGGAGSPRTPSLSLLRGTRSWPLPSIWKTCVGPGDARPQLGGSARPLAQQPDRSPTSRSARGAHFGRRPARDFAASLSTKKPEADQAKTIDARPAPR